MKLKIPETRFFSILLACAILGAGCGGGSNDLLIISPVGPTVVKKGETLQFSASRPDVTWSVEGGDANGSISASGLYTPPATLPATSPEVTVLAEDDGDVADATVSLRAGDALTFGSALPVTQSPLGTEGLADFGAGFMSNRFAVRIGSVKEVCVFSDVNGSVVNLFLSEAEDLGDFLEPVNLTLDNAISDLSIAVEIDGQLNPHVLFSRETTITRLMLRSSSDQGQSFATPVELAPDSDVDEEQGMGFMAMDHGGRFHVTFVTNNSTDNTSSMLYTRSDDGSTWSPVSTVDSGVDGQFIFPALAVSPDGGRIYVSYFDGVAGRLVFARSEDEGENFGASIPLSLDATAPFSTIALDSSGKVYVAFSDDLDTDADLEAVIRVSEDNGASFADAQPIHGDDGVNNDIFPSIAIDDLDRIDVVWSADSNADNALDLLNHARSLDGGATFSDPDLVASGNPSAVIVTRGLRHDEADRFYVHYLLTDGAFSSGSLFVKRAE